MPKPIDNPEQLSGQDRAELAAHEPAAAKLHELVAGAVKEVLGVERAEMLAEMKRVAQESAQAALGEREEASKGDAENMYTQRDMETMFRHMLGQAPAAAQDDDSTVRSLAKSAVYLCRAGGNPRLAIEDMQRAGASEKQLQVASKAMGVDDFSAGGALLQGDMFEDAVDELLSETAIVNDGAIQRIPVNGQLTIPYVTTGPTTNHTAEGAASNASDLTLDQLYITPHQASVIVPVSKKMMGSVPRAMNIIERAMKQSLAVDCDAELLRGVGGANKPTGLRYLANSSNLLNVNATVTVANRVIDLARLQEAVINSNVPINIATSRKAISPRTWRDLISARDNDGYPFRDEMLTQRTLCGVPLAGQSGKAISAIPENLSVTDSSETEIYFYTTDHLILGIGEDLRMEMSDTAAYNNSSGTVVSAFSRDQVVMKLVFSYDLGSTVRGHDISILTDCDWGV